MKLITAENYVLWKEKQGGNENVTFTVTNTVVENIRIFK